MRRREVIGILGGTAISWPLAARAQQKAMPVIGFLSSDSLGPAAPTVAAFRQGLGETGYVEGQNVAIEFRWAEGHYDQLPALAAALVGRRVDVIFSAAVTTTLAAKEATSTIPIVFLMGADPVAFGVVTSLSHPGGNLTGVAVLLGQLWPKRLELLHELAPKANVIGVLTNPANRNTDSNMENLQAAAPALGLRLEVLPASTVHDIDDAFATSQQRGIEALLIGDDPLFRSRNSQLSALAADNHIPTIYFAPEFAASGGLISYGPSFTAMNRIAGEYTGRILKGEKPADLPVQQPTKFELVINLKTANALGLTVPQSLLARADEVIE
jgi:putative ABC transport system substrate-binding protein